MKKICVLLFLMAAFVLSCQDKISTNDLISNLEVTPAIFQADGSTVLTLVATLNNDLDQRNVLFKADNGIFPDNKADSIIVVAEKINQQLVAITKMKAPSSAGSLTISAQMQIPDNKDRFVVTRHFVVEKSVPTAISLSASAFSVFTQYDSEITLTGVLSNANGKGVSSGQRVKIEDVSSSYLPFQGSFRNEKLSSDGSSQVSVVYSPGFVSPGQSIYLIATVLNESGASSGIADTVKVYITEKH